MSVGGAAPGKRVGVSVFDYLNFGREYRGSHQGDSIAKELCVFGPFLDAVETDANR